MASEQSPNFVALRHTNVNENGEGVQYEVFARPPLIPGESLASVVLGSEQQSLQDGQSTLVVSLVSASTDSSVVRVESYYRQTRDNAAIANKLALGFIGRLKRYHAAMGDPTSLRELIEDFKQEPLW